LKKSIPLIFFLKKSSELKKEKKCLYLDWSEKQIFYINRAGCHHNGGFMILETGSNLTAMSGAGKCVIALPE